MNEASVRVATEAAAAPVVAVNLVVGVGMIANAVLAHAQRVARTILDVRDGCELPAPRPDATSPAPGWLAPHIGTVVATAQVVVDLARIVPPAAILTG